MKVLTKEDIIAGINFVTRGNPPLSVEEWLKIEITTEDMESYPNAKKAAELKKTKLYKALK